MYEDSWYSYVPQESTNDTSAGKKHNRRESLLTQANGLEPTSKTGTMLDIYEISPGLKGPPQATLTQRSKSYSDFYDVAISFLSKDTKIETPRDVFQEDSTTITRAISYEEVEDEILDRSQEEYQLYRDQLALSERHLNTLLSNTADALDLLASLSQSFKAVESETTAFQAQCEDLLAEQQRLRTLADGVGTDLQYYAYLEPLTRRLNAPGAARVIRSNDFIDMLRNLVTCIDFMDEHPHYRDSTVYKTRYLSLLERSLNLVQTAFSSAMKELTDEVTKELREKVQTDTGEYICLYGKYETLYDKLEPQIQELLTTWDAAWGEVRDGHPQAVYVNKFHGLFSELTEIYIKSREPAAAVVRKKLQKFITDEKPDTEFESFARLCIQYILEICHNESTLMTKYFHDGPLLADFPPLEGWNKSTQYAAALENNMLSHLGNLSSTLMPYMNSGVEKICSIVNWLENLYMATYDGDPEDSSFKDKRLIVKQLLVTYLYEAQDAQFLKAAAEISQFKPTTEDLRLAINAAPLTGGKVRTGNSTNGQPDTEKNASNVTSRSYSYPTVQTAIKLLVMYHDGTYDRPRNSDVVYEIVHQVTESLQRAAATIKRTSGSMDGQLFLIKNLMLIENLFMTKEIPDSVRQSTEFDFTPIWNTMKELQDQKQLYNPIAYISPLVKGKLLPAVVDRMSDARKDMEKILVQQITDFTKTWKMRLADAKNGFDTERELDALLNKVFDDETTRAALWKMIRPDE